MYTGKLISEITLNHKSPEEGDIYRLKSYYLAVDVRPRISTNFPAPMTALLLVTSFNHCVSLYYFFLNPSVTMFNLLSIMVLVIFALESDHMVYKCQTSPSIWHPFVNNEKWNKPLEWMLRMDSARLSPKHCLDVSNQELTPNRIILRYLEQCDWLLLWHVLFPRCLFCSFLDIYVLYPSCPSSVIYSIIFNAILNWNNFHINAKSNHNSMILWRKDQYLQSQTVSAMWRWE